MNVNKYINSNNELSWVYFDTTVIWGITLDLTSECHFSRCNISQSCIKHVTGVTLNNSTLYKTKFNLITNSFFSDSIISRGQWSHLKLRDSLFHTCHLNYNEVTQHTLLGDLCFTDCSWKYGPTDISAWLSHTELPFLRQFPTLKNIVLEDEFEGISINTWSYLLIYYGQTLE